MLSAWTLDQLRVLIAVADAGSFSAAGRKLGRVQSAISQSVQGLETAFGVKLFDRSTKTPRLTEAGHGLVAQARQVLRGAEGLQAQAAAIAGGREPALTLAVDSLFPSPPLVAGLQALQRQFPDLPLTLHTEPITASLRRLREDGADLALCALHPSEAFDLAAEPLMWISLIPVTGPGHPLAGQAGPISRAELERHVQLILTDPLAKTDAPSFGVVSPRVWRFVELGRRLDFLKAGFGWGNVPEHLAEPLLKTGELVRLTLADADIAQTRIPFFAVHRRARPLGPAGRWLRDQLLRPAMGVS